ncbi:MAG TPA: NUDIX domain-containing protein [Burkholderiaceae bacterium]|nr:NUDIX domain-containing protein [Burkholderiaceae bacterium]
MTNVYRYCPCCAAPLERQVVAERERSRCVACGWVHWDNPTPVVAALIEYRGRVLLARNRAWPEKMFALVTGFLERDETPQRAVAREVAEETALATASASLIGVYEFTRKNEVIIAYHVLAEGEISLGEELADYRLIEPARLRPCPLGTGLAMADWMRARGLPVEFLPFPPRPPERVT